MDEVSKMKVWMLTFESIYTRKIGGLAEVPPRLSEALVGKGVEVEIYTPSHGLNSDPSSGKVVFETVFDGSVYSIREFKAPVKHYIVSGGLLDEPVVYSQNLLVKSLAFSRVIREYFASRLDEGRQLDIIHGHDWHSFPALLAVNAESTRRGVRVGIVYHIHLLSRTLINLNDIASKTGIRENDLVRGSLGVKPLNEYYALSNGWIERLAALTCDKILTVSKGYTRDVIRTTGIENASKVDYVPNATTWTWDYVLGVVEGFFGKIDPFRYETRKSIRNVLLRNLLGNIKVSNPDPYINEIVGRLLDKYGVIYNSPFRHDGPLILITGRVARQKGLDLVIKAMDKLVNEIPRARIIMALIPIAGSEDLIRELIEHTLVFPDNLRILPGYVDRDYYVILYFAASTLLAPSRYEPFGLVALEAFSAGTPVVASNTGGLRDLILDIRRYGLKGTGALFTPLNIDNMVDSLKLVIEAVEKSESAVIRENCVEHSKLFTWSNSASRLMRIYKEILGDMDPVNKYSNRRG